MEHVLENGSTIEIDLDAPDKIRGDDCQTENLINKLLDGVVFWYAYVGACEWMENVMKAECTIQQVFPSTPIPDGSPWKDMYENSFSTIGDY